MRLAADRDLVARQYVSGFREVLDEAVPTIEAGLDRGWGSAAAIVHAQLTLMSRFPDSLIARKCGPQPWPSGRPIMRRDVLQAGTPADDSFLAGGGDLDFWLRSDGHRRNPGTTADMIAAGLFALLRDGIMELGRKRREKTDLSVLPRYSLRPPPTEYRHVRTLPRPRREGLPGLQRRPLHHLRRQCLRAAARA